MSKQTRRTFLKQSAALGLGATFAISGTKASGQVIGANDAIRVAVAGINGRGNAHIQEYLDLKGVQVAALVDPDSRLFESHVSYVKRKAGNTPACYQDLRKALDDKELDAVSIATPNHWHSLLSIWSCQAGKHVYVEKPCSHNVFEGRKLAEAARKYKRLVQHGTQARSEQKMANQTAAVRSGKYGKLLVAKGYCCKPRWSIGIKPVAEPPKELDYNLWLGPAPEQPYHENLVHYNWHWFWDFGNGDVGNQGVHQMDVARWGIDGATLPESVWSLGLRWVETPDHKDQGQTPNLLLSVLRFGEVLLVFETRGLVEKKVQDGSKPFPFKVENEFYTTEGRVCDGKFYPKNGGDPEKIADQGVHVKPGGPFGSFIAALRSGQVEDLNAEILEGHYSSALCHLGNISYRLGQSAPFGQRPERVGQDIEVLESYRVIEENLWGVGAAMAETTCQVGPLLQLDPKAERFVDNEAANALLTRPYREGFVVPEEV